MKDFCVIFSRFGVFTFLVLSAFSAHALKTLELPLKLDKSSAVKPAVSSSLSRQREAQQAGRWAECVRLAKQNIKGNAEIRAWVALSFSDCALRVKPQNQQDLNTVLLSLRPFANRISHEPWATEVRAAYQEVLWTVVKSQSARQVGVSDELLQELFTQEGSLETSQKSQLYTWAAEKLQKQGQLQAALQFAEQAVGLSDRPEARAVRSRLRVALNRNDTQVVTERSTPGPWNDAEAQFEQRLLQAEKNKDAMVLLEDSLAYLRQFPNGKRASWADARILEVYFQFFERSQSQTNQERMASIMSRALSAMKKADATRVIAWARQMHRRGDFAGSLELAQVALKNRENSSDAAILLYISGRSAQFSGDYKLARSSFQSYLAEHGGAEDVNEVLFRLALVYLRLNQFENAVAVLEKLLHQPQIDRYELSARYWLMRSLEKTGNTARAESERDAIIGKSLFSYYGLRVYAEKNAGKLVWPEVQTNASRFDKAKLWLTESQKKAYDRAKLLARHEWYAEAQKEISNLPLPEAVEIKYLWTVELSKVHSYPRVMRLVSEVGDADANLRSADFISLSFPQIFAELISENAKRQNLSPYLVRSLIRQESAFALTARSRSNAMGLMQLIPPTAQEVVKELGLRDLNLPDDTYLPRINVQLGTHYLRKMLNQFSGNVPMALAAYNAGPTRMNYFVRSRAEVLKQSTEHSSVPLDEVWFDELPWFESSFYVKAILRNSLIYKMLNLTLDKKATEKSLTLAPVLWSDLVLPSENAANLNSEQK